MENVIQIAIGLLLESKTNPRQSYNKQKMEELEASIVEKGIIDPLIVRKFAGSTKDDTPKDDADHFEIVDGSRRYRAARARKLTTLATLPCIVRDLTDEQVLEYQVVLNEQREDVHPLEQAVGYDRLVQSGLSRAEVATRIGKPLSHVGQRLQYLKLIEPAKKFFLMYRIWASHADQLARLTPEQQKEVMTWFRGDDEVMSPQHMASQIRERFFLLLKDAPFDTESTTLVEAAGACGPCPKRSGSNKLLFPDVKDADTCTDHKCYAEKSRAFVKIQVGTHPDAVLLTIGTGYNTKPKGLAEWVKAGKEECEHTKEGIVVEILDHYPDENQKAKLGQTLKVCTNPKCRTHHPKPDYNPQTGGSRKSEKARKLELRRRALVFKELAANPFTIDNKKDYRAILDHMVDGLNSDHSRAICNAMEWEVAAKDYTGTIEKHLAKLDTTGIHQWIYLVMLAGTDLWFYNNTGIPKAELLDGKAKTAGIKLAEIAKLSKEKPKKVAAKKPAKKVKEAA